MELLHFRTCSQLLYRPVILKPRNSKAVHISMSKRNAEASSPALNFSRRIMFGFTGFITVMPSACSVLAGIDNTIVDSPSSTRTRKFDSGVNIQDIVEGEGPSARDIDTVEFNYVCRRSNGYFVHSTVSQFTGESNPVVLALDDDKMIEGLRQVIRGMKAGGKRRALIPPSVGYVNERLKPMPEEVVISV